MLQPRTRCVHVLYIVSRLLGIRLGFLPRSVWNKQTRIGPPSPSPKFCGAPALWDPPPPIAWRSCRRLPQKKRRKTPHPPPPPRPLKLPTIIPSFCRSPLSVFPAGAGPAAEAARASMYNYKSSQSLRCWAKTPQIPRGPARTPGFVGNLAPGTKRGP